MELAIDRLTKQYKNKIAVDRVSIKLKTRSLWITWCKWSRKNNTYENDMWYSKSNFWSN